MKWQYLSVADPKDSSPQFCLLLCGNGCLKVRHLYLFHVVFKCIAKKEIIYNCT